MTTAELILQELRKRADVVQAENSRRFSKPEKANTGRVTFSLELSCLK